MTYQRVRTLEAKVDALIAHQTEQDEQRHSDAQQNTQLMKMLSLKYFLFLMLRLGNSLTFKQTGFPGRRRQPSRIKHAVKGRPGPQARCCGK
jgi:hypothetical protein